MNKRTSFYDIHAALGAKIIPFGGFEMPVNYPAGILSEHKAVRERVGVFDVSHMGEFIVRGDRALEFLQRVTVNDVSKLSEGKVQYSAMCYPTGGIVDDLLVYHAGDHYMLVVNASNIDKDFSWLRENVGEGVELLDRSDSYSLLAVQGPRALETMQKLTATDVGALAYYTFTSGIVAGIPAIISRTGYTGERGYELYFASGVAGAKAMWDALFEAGKEFDIAPIGLGARDTLRLEMGYMLYGNDIDQTTTPLEAGLGWITKLDKGNFLGREVMAAQKKNGLPRKLVGLIIEERGAIPRHGYEVHAGGAQVGEITSGTQSPMRGCGVAMGYATLAASKLPELSVKIRDRFFPAKVVKPPFVDRSPQ